MMFLIGFHKPISAVIADFVEKVFCLPKKQ
jgi:hypothetical protein